MPLESPDEPLSPDWWLLRLGRQLAARRPQLDLWWNYFSGDHPLPEGPRRATEAYRDFQKKARSNFCMEVANSSVNRLRVVGIVDDQGRPDDEAWRWWTLNRMTARQAVLWRATLALSRAYLMVGEHPRQARRPLVTLEHPRQVIVDTDPATGERRAAVKAWYDDIAKRARANVYLPTETIKYATGNRGPGPMRWGPRVWTRLEGAEGGGLHGMSQVPVVPFECRPFLGEEPAAEFDNVIDNQDRINLGVLNRMTAERYSAFRQKWVKGHKFKKTIDPETGLEIIQQPFVPDPGAVWASENGDTDFGEFQQTQLDGYLRAHEADIRDLLIISRTPAYTYSDLVNIGADTIEALDISHVAKVGEHMGNFAEGLEDTWDLCAEVAAIDRDFTVGEFRWMNPRLINPAVAADAAVKKRSLGYPLSVLAEDLGESPQRIERITSEVAADALMGARALQLAAGNEQTARDAVPAAGLGDGSA